MSHRVDFDVVCPNNHNQSISLSEEDFHAALKSGGLKFHCNTCEANWSPSHEDVEKLRRRFAKESE